jgi:histidinol-phosphate aminotransferase
VAKSVIRVNPVLASLRSYDPPWDGLDRSLCLRLDLNECTQPIPPAVADRIADSIRSPGVNLYPSYTGFAERLSAYAGVPADHLLLTNGSDQGIDLLLRGLLSKGDELLIATPEFPMFTRFARLNEIKVKEVQFGEEFEFPEDLFEKAVTRKTRLIVIINPNNPTGTPVRQGFIKRLLQKHPGVPVLVDEAYYEYTSSTSVKLLPKYKNLVILRTFSKGFALAGLRLGYVVARPKLIAELGKCRGPFDVNRLAVEAATAQLENPEVSLDHVHEVMTRSKPYVEEYWRSAGIRFYPGAANFMLVEPPDREALVQHLAANKILVRSLHVPRLDKVFRMSLGTLAEMKRFTTVVDDYIRGLRDTKQLLSSPT